MSEGEGSRTVVNWKLKVDDCKLILESLEVSVVITVNWKLKYWLIKKKLAASTLIRPLELITDDQVV